MDKEEIKKQIARYKEDLAKHKKHYKMLNDNFKKHISDLQKQAGYQTNKDIASRMRREIKSKKELFARNEKRSEKLGTDRIKSEIERLRARLNPKKESGWF